jgi:hypothetical protein
MVTRMATDLRERIVALVYEVQKVPYAWPGPPDAASVREYGVGTCASKHALLAEELLSVGIASVPLLVVGPLVPETLRDEEDCRPGLSLLEVHECVTVLLPWAGPVRVDVTWDPALAEHGLAITRPWDGSSDMLVAVTANGPGWAVERERLRTTKEALRRRLYGSGERPLRDRTLRAISDHFARWRITRDADGARSRRP